MMKVRLMTKVNIAVGLLFGIVPLSQALVAYNDTQYPIHMRFHYHDCLITPKGERTLEPWGRWSNSVGCDLRSVDYFVSYKESPDGKRIWTWVGEWRGRSNVPQTVTFSPKTDPDTGESSVGMRVL